ncbi:peptidoglycan-binding domain-containing protein [Roseococcus sp.]
MDSNFGPATRASVQEFQRANLLPATGDLDPETMRKLFP